MCEACVRTCWLLAPGSVCMCVGGGGEEVWMRGNGKKKGGGRGEGGGADMLTGGMLSIMCWAVYPRTRLPAMWCYQGFIPVQASFPSPITRWAASAILLSVRDQMCRL